MDAEEAILGALSPEEIACLVDQLEEIDPENELLPAGKTVNPTVITKVVGLIHTFIKCYLVLFLSFRAMRWTI